MFVPRGRPHPCILHEDITFSTEIEVYMKVKATVSKVSTILRPMGLSSSSAGADACEVIRSVPLEPVIYCPILSITALSSMSPNNQVILYNTNRHFCLFSIPSDFIVFQTSGEKAVLVANTSVQASLPSHPHTRYTNMYLLAPLPLSQSQNKTR